MPNFHEASILLQKEMQREAWPKGLESIYKLDLKQRQEIISKSPFLDESDGLIKVGGRLSQADLSHGRKQGCRLGLGLASGLGGLERFWWTRTRTRTRTRIFSKLGLEHFLDHENF